MINKFTQGQAAQEILVRRQMRKDYAPFIKRVVATVAPGSTFVTNWHIDLISEYLMAVYRGELRRLCINIPPRSLKTILCSIGFPAWLLGKDPTTQILCASYSARLSLKDSVDTRLVMQQPWYQGVFPGVELVKDMNTKNEFQTTKRGKRVATSAGGSCIGYGADYILIDDIQNPLQALSDTEREKSSTWVEQNLLTRLNNEKTGAIINIQQRLHTSDATALLLDKGYEHLSIPLIAQKKEYWDFGSIKHTREKGELLHPERFGPEEVKQKKLDLGSYAWAGQYLQMPAPIEGNMIKLEWFNRYASKPTKFIKTVHSWDTASKDSELNDFSALTVWAETEDGYYLLETYKEKLRYPDLKKAVINFAERDNPDVILIEDKSSGIALIQDLKTDTKLPVIPVNPVQSKVVRLDCCAPLIESGQVWLPTKAPWLIDLEQELINFPNIVSKDSVDSISQFLNYVKKPKLRPRLELF